MKTTKSVRPTPGASSVSGDKQHPWPQPRTVTVRARAEASSPAYSVSAVYHPPTDVERMREDVERWDGLA